jgi:ornithine cyclodeaminase/alanine dehydrogenase-like protein (mu-crystallin family)
MTDYYDNEFLYLCRKEVELVGQEIDGVALIRDLFRLHATGGTILPDEAYLTWENERGERARSLNMPGYIGGSIRRAGTKIINGNIANSERGLPRASGMTVLYDDVSARVVCIMESAYISSLRTACVTALAADLLHGAEIEQIAIIGAGVQAQAHISVLVKSLPQLRVIHIYDLDKTRISALSHAIDSLLEVYNVTLKPAHSVQDAIRPAQLIIPVTTVTEGYIPFAWLQPGALLINVSLDDPLPEVILQADRLFVDDWNLVKQDSRRLIGRMYRAGQVIGPDAKEESQKGICKRVDGELGEILLGIKEGRVQKSDVILVNPFGLAIEDIIIADRIYHLACEKGLGTRLAR